MPPYQFIIIVALIVVGFAFSSFLLIRLILLRRSDANRISQSVTNGIESSLLDVERRLNLKTDASINEYARDIEQLKSSINDSVSIRLDGVSNLLGTKTDLLSENITSKQIFLEQQIEIKQESLKKQLVEQMSGMKELLESQARRSDERLRVIDASMKEIRDVNEKQLDSIRGVVNEKLQQTLNERLSESFKRVDERLAEVYKGLGEMQALASGVGDLKKVLSNVKTRGTLGEIQLHSILEEILAPGQYELNFDAGKGSSERVEFAIRLPNNDSDPVFLPIDSKFPADIYTKLYDAYDAADPSLIDAARRSLRESLLRFARDISDKYINPPRTTSFAIMFLPTEGLYAEAVRLGMIEQLQSKYRINIAGPSTMAALLNSLQMGFRTLAIQKRSGEVWEILARIKIEFNSFDDVLTNTRKALLKANDELDKLVGVRTRQIRRALDKVETLPQSIGTDAVAGPQFIEPLPADDTEDIE